MSVLSVQSHYPLPYMECGRSTVKEPLDVHDIRTVAEGKCAFLPLSNPSHPVQDSWFS